MRLVYLDEAGIDRDAAALCVAGVLIDADHQLQDVNDQIVAVIKEHIPEGDQYGFVFHAMDIYHGKKYFSSSKPEWSHRNRRYDVMHDLAMIIKNCNLPIVAGSYVKEEFGKNGLPEGINSNGKGMIIHSAAALDCLMWTERWLSRFASNERALVIHEDGEHAKKLIKMMLPAFLNEERLVREGLPEEVMREYGLPFKRIIDTIHFVAKPDARALQLADLCAFCLSRANRKLAFLKSVGDIFKEQIDWMTVCVR